MAIAALVLCSASGRRSREATTTIDARTPDGSEDQFNVWSTTWVNDKFQTSRMFRQGLPFSVTVASQSQSSAERVMRELRFRGAAQTENYKQ